MEAMTGLSNTVLACKEWKLGDPHFPIQHLISPNNMLPEEVLLKYDLPLIVDFPTEYQGKLDMYIDDTSTIDADIGDNSARMDAEEPLIIHVVGRPLAKK